MMLLIVSLAALLTISCYCDNVTTSGFITIIDAAYEVSKLNMITLLGHITLPSVKRGSRDLKFEQNCRNRCVMDPQCQGSSVTYNTYNQPTAECVWFANSLCDGKTSLTAFARGETVYTFEKKQTTDQRSCFDICLEQNMGNCTKCFRPGCTGPKCDQCPRSCAQYKQYNKPDGPEITTDFRNGFIWFTNKGGFSIQVPCSGLWAVIFTRQWKQNMTEMRLFIPENYFTYIYNGRTNNLLMIELISNDDKIYRAVYQNFTISNTSLTIRNYLNDSIMYRGNDSFEAGDGFKVPVRNAPFLNSIRPECGNFWALTYRSLSSSTFNSCTTGTYFLGTPRLNSASYSNSTRTEVPMGPTGIAWSTLPGLVFKSVTIKVRMP